MAELRRYDMVVQGLLSSLLLYGWKCRKDQCEPQPGDIVMLQSAPQSEWHLSFYREAGPGESFNQKHLLESLKTGKLCWWQNVGFHVLDRDKCAIGERAEWTDAQFEFADKFDKACRRADFYCALPFIDRFEGDLVVIKFRTRFHLNEKRTELPPFRWRKVTHRALLTLLLEGESTHKGEPANG